MMTFTSALFAKKSSRSKPSGIGPIQVEALITFIKPRFFVQENAGRRLIGNEIKVGAPERNAFNREDDMNQDQVNSLREFIERNIANANREIPEHCHEANRDYWIGQLDSAKGILRKLTELTFADEPKEARALRGADSDDFHCLKVVKEYAGNITVAVTGVDEDDAVVTPKIEFLVEGHNGITSPETMKALSNLIEAMKRDNKGQTAPERIKG